MLQCKPRTKQFFFVITNSTLQNKILAHSSTKTILPVIIFRKFATKKLPVIIIGKFSTKTGIGMYYYIFVFYFNRISYVKYNLKFWMLAESFYVKWTKKIGKVNPPSVKHFGLAVGP